jgi:cysteine-rich repeat protein
MIRVDRRATQGLVWSSLLLGAFAACSETVPTDETENNAESTKHSTKATGGVPVIVRVQLTATVSGGTSGTVSSSTTAGSGGNSSGGTTSGANASATVPIIPLVSTYCGDGIPDANTEECDDGIATNGALCNGACQITDSWVESSNRELTTGERWSRHLGRGMHSVAASDSVFAVALVEQVLPHEDAVVRLNTFNDLGIRTGSHVVSEGTLLADEADPVVAVLPNGDVLAAYTEVGGDGDGLGIALRRLRAGQPQMDEVRYVSEPSFASQQHADMLALTDGVVVAYSDESDAVSGPDVRVREFDLELNERANRVLSFGAGVDGKASLAAMADSWAVAWRTLADSGEENIVVYDASTNVRWVIGPHVAGPSGEQPALLQIDEYHRMVLFSAGTDPDGDGVYTTGKLQYAVLDTRAPDAPVNSGPLAHSAAYDAFATQNESRPSLVRVGTEAYLAWQSGAISGDANGEEVWLKRISSAVTSGQLEITLNPEMRLPRLDTERYGDQRNASLALLGPSARHPRGALVSAWEDFGQTLGVASGKPDVLLQFAPLPLRREATVTRHITGIGCGRHHCCSIVDGRAYCWGYNLYGELGNNSNANSVVPVQVNGLTSGVASIECGTVHTCAVVNGSAMCWGNNEFGQVGNNSATDSWVPVQVNGLNLGVSDISAGRSFSCATANGSAYCWGNNYYGTLGDNSRTNRLGPVQVSGLTSGVTATCGSGYYHNCAIVNGGVRCWGTNNWGQLGNGSTVSSLVPVQVSGLTSGATAITCDNAYVCAVVNGGAQCWGLNTWGQLGNNTTTDSNVPVHVTGLSAGVSAISSGGFHSCAIVNGGAYCWGDNSHGQLGNHSTVGSLVPVQVIGLTSGVTAISSGSYYTCALVNGDAYCWGYNISGQLGNNSTIDSWVPVPVQIP